MKEVIKHGNKKYKTTCYTCGCEFTYELEDIITGIVLCPDCGASVAHYPDDFIRGSALEDKKDKE